MENAILEAKKLECDTNELTDKHNLRRSTRTKKPVITYMQEALAENEYIRERLSSDSQKLGNDGNIKRNRSLETIFEDPKVVKNQIQYMSSRRLKRLKDINVPHKPITTTKKKKLLKAGILKKSGRKENISVDDVIKKLTEIDEHN